MRLGTVLAGFLPDRRGRDGLALAALLARAGARLVVGYVQPPAWPAPGPAKVDAEWRAYLAGQAEATLAQARSLLGGRPAEYAVGANRGSGRGLLELAVATAADLIVIGSAPGGAPGRIALGSTADQLLHASTIPVALAPAGYAEAPPAAVERLTVAYLRRPESDAVVPHAVALAEAWEAPVRLLTVLARGRTPGPVEELMLAAGRAQYERDLAAAAARAGNPPGTTVELAEGADAAEALAAADWLPGEVLICASSSAGPVQRIFMGDMSLKIIRAAPCPVLVFPRATAQPGR